MAFEMWNGSVCVTITVGISPMCRVSGATRAAISTASRRPGHPVGRATDWTTEAVLDGDEVEQAALGLGDDVGPVAAGEQLGRAGPRLAPRGGMPAGAVERDGQVEGGGVGGHSFAPNPSNEIGIIEIIESSRVLFPGIRVDHMRTARYRAR